MKRFSFLLLPAALIVGTILRVYKILSNYYFSGELGKELIYMRQFSLSHTFPLVGMTTSHEWLRYGPIYYWIMIPIFNITKGDPFILLWAALIVSILGIYLSYWVFSKIVNQKFALILTFFVSVSPLWIWMTRLAKLHTFFFVLIPLVIYFLFKIWNKDVGKMFWLGLTFGTLFSFHFSQIPLLIVVFFAFWIKRNLFRVKDYLKFALGMLIPNATILIYDARSGFPMLKDLILWIPYRMAGFIGIYPKNNLDVVSGGTTIGSFSEFFGRNLFWDSRVWILGAIIFILLFVTFVVQNKDRIFKDFFVFYVVTSTIIQCIALLIHTTPPVHYFLPIFLNFGLLFSYFTVQYWNHPTTKILTVGIFVLTLISGFLALGNEHANDSDYIPLTIQENAVSYILKDAKDKEISVRRIGPYDYFPEEYSQSYKYLVLWSGGNLVDTSTNTYTIVSEGEDIYVQK